MPKVEIFKTTLPKKPTIQRGMLLKTTFNPTRYRIATSDEDCGLVNVLYLEDGQTYNRQQVNQYEMLLAGSVLVLTQE